MLKQLNYCVAQWTWVSVDIALKKGCTPSHKSVQRFTENHIYIFMLLLSFHSWFRPQYVSFPYPFLNTSLRTLHFLTFSYDSLISCNLWDKLYFFFGHKYIVRNFRIGPLKKTILIHRNRPCCCCLCSCTSVGCDLNIILRPVCTLLTRSYIISFFLALLFPRSVI